MAVQFEPRDNDLYEWDEPGADGAPAYVRIVRVPALGGALCVIAAPDRFALTEWMAVGAFASLVATGRLRLRRPDPLAAGARATSDLTTAEAAVVARRWRTIEGLLADPEARVLWPEHRGALVAGAAKALRVGRGTVYDNLRMYFQGGQFRNSLTPKLERCGGAGKPRIYTGAKLGANRKGGGAREGVLGPRWKDIMLQAVPLVAGGLSMSAARDQVLLDNLARRVEVDGKPGWELPREAEMPTLRQFRYWCGKETGRGGLARLRMGRVRHDNDYAAKPGSLRAGLRGPGELYQVDATLGDVFLRSAHAKGRLVGRPVIYVVADVYTGMIVGYHVCLKPPAVREMRLAIENAFADKVEYCASLGIGIEEAEWPSHHRPGRLLTDGGPEFVSEFLGQVGVDLGFSVSTAPPYDPTKKGLVEGKFALMKTEFLVWAPGTYRERVRGDKPCKLDAVYDLSGFRKALAMWILEHNAKRSSYWPDGWVSPDGSDPTLVDLWHYGVRRNGCPQDAREGVARLALLERAEGRLSQTGLRFHSRLYVPADRSEAAVLDRIPGGSFGRRRVRYDARDISSVVVYAGGGGRGESVWNLAAEEAKVCLGWSEDEYEDHSAWRLQGRRQAAVEDLRGKARWRTGQQALIDEKAAEMGGLVAKVGPGGIREDRRAEVLAASADARAERPPAGPAAVPPPRRSFAPSVVD